jgi:DNA invertase Pin-like site-specific DNA recombinase
MSASLLESSLTVSGTEGVRPVRVGYVRVGSVDQNTVRQLDGIKVERTFTDKASGKDSARPKLDDMLAFVRDGDTVIVHSMDRLARNLDDLRRLVRTLTGKGVRVGFVKENLVSPARTRRWPPCCCRSWAPSPSSNAP